MTRGRRVFAKPPHVNDTVTDVGRLKDDVEDPLFSSTSP